MVLKLLMKLSKNEFEEDAAPKVLSFIRTNIIKVMGISHSDKILKVDLFLFRDKIKIHKRNIQSGNI